MTFGGETYSAGQALIEASTRMGDGAVDSSAYDEWMTCDHGAEGWLLFGDGSGKSGFGEPHITGDGQAEERHQDFVRQAGI